MEAHQYADFYKRKMTRFLAIVAMLLAVAFVSLASAGTAQGSSSANGQAQAASGDAGSKPAAESGASLYKSTCSPCHQANRQGNAPDYPSLIGVSTRYKDQEITEIIKGGLGKMPPFSDLTNDEIAAIIGFLKSADQSQTN